MMTCLQITGDEFFADVARDILTYVSRDLSDEVHSIHKIILSIAL